MSTNPRTPPPRNLDIYRLVIARGLKQTQVAELFGITPVRVHQVCAKVRRWVDHSIGDWLFPRADDFRFYAALASANIRVHELNDHPEPVLFTAPDWTYRREINREADATSTTPPMALNSATKLSPNPLNFSPDTTTDPLSATPTPATDCVPPHIVELARSLAELLILWQKSRRASGAFKSWR